MKNVNSLYTVEKTKKKKKMFQIMFPLWREISYFHFLLVENKFETNNYFHFLLDLVENN